MTTIVMENFTKLEDFGSHVDASNDFTHVKTESEDETEEEEFMPNQESENPPETETMESAIHPYADVIQSFEYQQEQVEVFDVGTVKKLDETSFQIIRTQEALKMMIWQLRSQREISLVPQIRGWEELIVLTIGTMEKEYVIDGMKLGMSLVALKGIFINPKILKVVYHFDLLKILFHTTYKLYLVNVFEVKPAYILKDEENVAFNVLICQQYGCERVHLYMKKIMNDLLNPHVIMDLRKQAHYLFYLYHDIKNYLLLNDEVGYMNLLEKMQKESMSLKFDKKEIILNPIRNEFIQYHKCQLDVLQKVDDWRYAKFGKEHSESGLPKKHLSSIAKELPQTARALVSYTSGKPNVNLSLDNINEILDIVKESRIQHSLPILNEVKKKDLKVIAALERAQQQPQQSNNIQINPPKNIQINPPKNIQINPPQNIQINPPKKKPNKHRNRTLNRRQRAHPYEVKLVSNVTQNMPTRGSEPILNSTNNEMFSSGSSTSYAQGPQNKIQLIEDKSVKNSIVKLEDK